MSSQVRSPLACFSWSSDGACLEIGRSLLKKSLISSSSKKKPACIAFEEAELINKKVIRLSKGSKHITQQSKKEAERASVGKGCRPQPRELQHLLKVVTCCDHQRFAVDAEDAP